MNIFVSYCHQAHSEHFLQDLVKFLSKCCSTIDVYPYDAEGEVISPNVVDRYDLIIVVVENKDVSSPLLRKYLTEAFKAGKPVIFMQTQDGEYKYLLNTEHIPIELGRSFTNTMQQLCASFLGGVNTMNNNNRKTKTLQTSLAKPSHEKLLGAFIDSYLASIGKCYPWFAAELFLDEEVLDAIVKGELPVEEIDNDLIADMSRIFKIPTNIFSILLGREIKATRFNIDNTNCSIWEKALQDVLRQDEEEDTEE